MKREGENLPVRKYEVLSSIWFSSTPIFLAEILIRIEDIMVVINSWVMCHCVAVCNHERDGIVMPVLYANVSSRNSVCYPVSY